MNSLLFPELPTLGAEIGFAPDRSAGNLARFLVLRQAALIRAAGNGPIPEVLFSELPTLGAEIGFAPDRSAGNLVRFLVLRQA